MKTIIRTWGNSLALRLPKAFAVHMGIDSGKEVELLLEADGLRIVLPAQDLDALLERVTPENMHGETATGFVTGKEEW